MTKLEKRLKYLRARIRRLEKDRENGIFLLVLAETTLPPYRKELQRLTARLLKLSNSPVPDAGVAQNPSPVPVAHVAEDRGAVDDAPVEQEKPGTEPLAGQLDELEIPGYLRRTQDTTRPFNPYEEQHKAVNQEKARTRIAKMKAKATIKEAELTGKTRKWPLSGRDAERALKR